MKIFLQFALLLCIAEVVQSQEPRLFKLTDQSLSPRLRSNSVNDLVAVNGTLWVAGGKGISVTTDRGISWNNYANTGTFDEKGVSAIALRGRDIWIATSYTTKKDDQSFPTGHGLHYSSDAGVTWKFISQPLDAGKFDTLSYGNNKIAALAVTVPQQNLVYDIALTSNTVWIATWAGMLRKSTDHGMTWQRVVLPPDNLNAISPRDTLQFTMINVDRIVTNDATGKKDTLKGSNNFLLFSVLTTNDSTIWAGTANGINKSTDGGISWRKFNHQNQKQPISGNFVVALAEQRWNNQSIIWAATVNAVDQEEKRGVSFTTDGGETWNTTLLGEFAHNFAFQDSLVYIVTDNGLFRSSNFGLSWIRNGTIVDPQNRQRFTGSELYAVATRGNTIWTGGPEGLASTTDSPQESFGTQWSVFRTYLEVGSNAATYSYPLPFSPDDEAVRLHYSTNNKTAAVTIRIFNFAMQPVRTLIRNAIRSGLIEHDEIWDGKDDSNRSVANGAYFYRIEIEGGNTLWGKILVIQ
ncbi:MAG: hypothetical protein V1799_07235 [bacterium]